jgi:hypothetical protein
MNNTASDNAAEFIWKKDDVFGRIASRYDPIHTARKPR